MIDKKIIAVRRVQKVGGSLGVVLPSKYCRRENIERGDFYVFMDRGTRLTGTSLKQFEFDKSLTKIIERKEGEK